MLILLVVGAAFLLLCLLGPPLLLTLMANDKMAAGVSIMNGLTEADMQTWIDRADDYANRHPDTLVMLSGDDVPAELKALGIIQVDVFTALARSVQEVGFVWLGLIDHTILWVELLPEGGHKVIAQFNDHTKKQLYPPLPSD